MVSIMNEALKLEAGQKILEVGSGCGWHASTIAEIVAPKNTVEGKIGHVFTIEILPRLALKARNNVKLAGYEDRVTVINGDGSNGYLKEAPYDRIVVAAAAPFIPSPLMDQLKSDGIMVIPVGRSGFCQSLLRVRKIGNKILREDLGSVMFVPLVGKHGHKKN